jgi:two-component SAPR family response regulator
MRDEKIANAKSRRIMIIENNDDLNLTFKVVLSESDPRLRIYSFIDCIEALQEFQPNFYDLIIINIMMPKINGIRFYDIVRGLDDRVKICYLTTVHKDVIKKAYPEVERFGLLKIPVTNEELVRTTKEILELYD